MGKSSFWCKCLRRQQKPDTRRVAAIEVHVPTQQSPTQPIFLPQPVQIRAQPQPQTLTSILIHPTLNPQTQLPVEKKKAGQVKVTSNYDFSKIECRDFKPERREKFKFNYSCPICYRYFNHIFQTTCCKHYLCKNCIDDFNRFAEDKEIEHLVCHFCKVPDLAVVDVNMDASIRRYTDSSVGSPANAITNGPKASIFGSEAKKKSKKSKKELEKEKNSTFSAFATEQDKHTNVRLNNSYAEGFGERTNNRRRSYISEGEQAKSFDHESDHNEEEKLDVISFEKVNSVKTDVENQKNVSSDSINHRHPISVISERDSEDMIVSTELFRDREISKINSKSPLEPILNMLNRQIAPAQDDEEEEDDKL